MAFLDNGDWRKLIIECLQFETIKNLKPGTIKKRVSKYTLIDDTMY